MKMFSRKIGIDTFLTFILPFFHSCSAGLHTENIIWGNLMRNIFRPITQIPKTKPAKCRVRDEAPNLVQRVV
jgi:hypothetical protein